MGKEIMTDTKAVYGECRRSFFMKVLILNGSPHPNGNTSIAVAELTKAFDALGVETEVVQIGQKAIRGCVACNYCKSHGGKCVFDDGVNEIAEKFAEADGLIVATPASTACSGVRNSTRR